VPGRWHRHVRALACCAALAAVAGCAAPAELPDGVRVEVLQGRTDYTSGTLVIRVVNDSASDLELERALLSWAGFSGSALWERGTTVRRGITVDLRAPVPEVDCDDGDPVAAPTAELGFSNGNRRAAATVPVADPLSTLNRLREAGCITEQVDRVAAVSVGSPVVEGSGRSSVAVVGRVDITQVSSTPLLRPDPAAYPDVEDWPVGLGVDSASDTVTTELRVVPARCDAHAIADDKVGTVLNLAVRLSDGSTGEYALIPPEAVRDDLLDYVRAACGLL
jgi:hypothetical protein